MTDRASAEGLTPDSGLVWRQCICSAWYWGVAQTDGDKATSRALPDRASAEGRIDALRKVIDRAVDGLNHAWAETGDASWPLEAVITDLQQARTNDDIAQGRDWPPVVLAALRDTGPRPDSGIDVLEAIARTVLLPEDAPAGQRGRWYAEGWGDRGDAIRQTLDTGIGTDEDRAADLAGYATDAARAAARLSTPRTETSEPCTCRPFFAGHVIGHPDCPRGRAEHDPSCPRYRGQDACTCGLHDRTETSE